MDKQGESGLVFWIGFGCGVIASVAVWFVVSFVKVQF